jgi:hypothetical protein
MLPSLVEKTKQVAKCQYAFPSFDLWMSKGGHDIFALVIRFLGINWQPKHATLGLFCAMDTFG